MAGLEEGINELSVNDSSNNTAVKTAQQLRRERATEQSRHTKAYNAIVAKIKQGREKAELEQCREKLTALQQCCLEAHNRLVTARDYVPDPSDNFFKHIHDTTQLAYLHIEDYFRKLDYRPPSDLLVVTNLDTGEQRVTIRPDDIDKLVSLRGTPKDSVNSLGAKPKKLVFETDTTQRAGSTLTESLRFGNPFVEQLQSMLVDQADLFQQDRARRDENERFYRETIERQQRQNESVMAKLLDRLEKVEGQHSTPNVSAINVNNSRADHRGPETRIQRQHPTTSIHIPYVSDDAVDEEVASASPQTPRVDTSRWSFNISNPTHICPSGQQRRSIFRMPKIDVEPFAGDPKAWPNFIANFRDMVHLDENLTNTQKMAILRKCLAPNVQQSLGDCLNDPDMYGAALDELESTYGHPHLVSRTYIRSILNLPKISSSNDFNGLLSFSNTIRGAVASLKNGGYVHELAAGSLLEVVIQKIPSDLQSKWGKQIVKLHPTPLNLQHFSAWLHNIIKAEMMVKHDKLAPAITPVGEKKKPNRQQGGEGKANPPPPTILATTPQQKSAKQSGSEANDKSSDKVPDPQRCPLCQNGHPLKRCPRFESKTVVERAETVKDLRVCFRCLRKGHRSSDCYSKKKCGVDDCTYLHHQLLHGAPKVYPAATTEPNSESNPPEEKEVKFAGTVGTAAIPKSESSVLLAVVPVTIKNGDLKLNTYALLDSGSEATLIVSSAAKKINIDGPTEDITLATFHGEDPSIEVKKVQFSIASRDGSSLFETTQSLVVPKINISKRKCHWPSVKKEWPHLADLMLPAVDSSHVNVLIGRDVVGAHDVFEQKRPPKGAAGPEAILTPFGWCVVGPVPSSAFRKGQHPILNVNAIHPRDDNQLAENVSQMWKTESFGILPPSEPVRSQIDKTALALLQSTIRHIGDRYEVGLMWKSDNITLPDNRSSALRQFRALQRRFIKDPSYAEKYDKVISEYISLGHARKTEEDDKGTPGRVWYLHQHGVTSPHKPDKVRVVFNCSARYLNTSLNEVLMKGPDLLTSMVGVLLRFRQHPVPVAGDIEKMYHQVKVPAADQSSLRFFYCKPGSQQIDTYQMTVHVFGAISSPTSCLFALKRTAQDQRETYPIAAAMIDQNTYVDNLLYSAETEEEATRNAHYFKTACLHGGFKVVQWMSTSRQLLATVAPAELSTPFLNLDLDKLPVERTLGVHLDWNSDHFLFKFVSRPVTTMREALREMSSVHDPLGLICVLTISVRILFQDIWRAGLEWDEELPASLRDAWASWAKEMAAVENLRIPRCIRLTVKLKNFELHAFSDASELGFGAGVYGRVTHENGQISIRLLMGKARVSPLRQLSIPRLELQGAVMAARIVSTLKKELTVLISKTTYWTDSQTVLQWLRSTTCRYHAFVAHRVTEILDGADPRQWRHIPGELNTADDASRGIPASSLTANHRWLTGPSFLELTPDLWPADLSVGEPSPSDPEVSPVQWVGVHTIIEPHYLIKLGRKESSFERLKRLVGWYRRFLHNYPDKGQKKLSQTWLTVPELRDAVTLLVKVDQRHYFLRELITLKKSKPVPAASEVCQLSPVLDIHGVMRVGGRLVNGKFSEDSKHPIILHHRSALAKLIVMDLHCQLAHSSADRVINDLRHRYYVLRIVSSLGAC